MIDKQKILEILNKESVSENSSNNNRVIIEQDFEIVAEEIVKLFAIPVVVKSFTAEEVINVLDSSCELIDAKSFFEDCKK
tara:strand:- start:81 stop:320 length:240 start_codon:yes stop_codon:yes gene_type:complete